MACHESSGIAPIAALMPALTGADGGDHRGGVVSGVHPHDDGPGAAAGPGGGDGPGGEPGRAAGGRGVPAAQPRGGGDRGRQRGTDRGDQRVQAANQHGLALNLGMAELRAFLLVPVDPLLRRVDVDEGQHVRAGQQRRLPRQPGQELPARPLDLQHVSPGIRAQVRPERGRGAHPGEQHVHRPVPQQAHVIDRVGTRGHARDQAADLQGRVHPALPARPDVPGEQFRKARTLREGRHGHQAAVRDEVRVIEHGTGPREGMRQSHLRGVLSDQMTEA